MSRMVISPWAILASICRTVLNETSARVSQMCIRDRVLNDYDQETQHFFRWQVSYPAEQLSELVYRKIGIDFGTIRDIQPIERGVSGRLIRVKITGDKKTLVIGKELIIRKAFSE